MNPDRLAQLKRQRELIRGHLAWLDAEIASADGEGDRVAAADAGTEPRERTPPAEVSPVPSPAGATPVVEEDLPNVDTRDIQSEVRRGCLIYAGIAALALIGLVAVIYLVY